jgi:hypothetical protein
MRLQQQPDAAAGAFPDIRKLLQERMNAFGASNAGTS